MKGTLIAIDPGAVSGALAVRLEDGTLEVGDLPVVNGQLDAATLSRAVRHHRTAMAVIEQVGAMPKQGLASTFKFGVACGLIRGVLAANGVPIIYVAPQTWKRHHGLIGKDKEASRALAIQRHPTVVGLELKKHQGRAEALLMLDWYLRDRMIA